MPTIQTVTSQESPGTLRFDKWFEAAEQFLELSHTVDELFLNAEPEGKRRLLQTVASNGILKDRKVVLNLKRPSDVLIGWQNRGDWWSVVDALRTWFTGEPGWVVGNIVDVAQRLAGFSDAQAT